jgi:hypothetical protein
MSIATKYFFNAALRNVVEHGDTDIFPFPIENHILHDKCKEVSDLLRKARSYFSKCFAQYPPSHINTLAPVSLTGFRSATQQDPFWNVFLLGSSLSIAPQIDAARIPPDKKIIFSYRYNESLSDGKLFRDDIGWSDFIRHSVSMAERFKYVVVCDIADCYQRISHHRLDNALEQLAGHEPARSHIMKVMKHFSNTKSYGLPVGGPAARMLVELVLNLTDQILLSHQVQFCRYADDYHIFVDSYDDVSWSAVNEARGRLEKFEDIKPDDLREPTAEEWQEIFRVARSFSRFVADQSAGSLLVKFAPTFRGCGLLDACAGDILIGNKLFEVKAGDRPYRSSDLRQLLTYCSLNSVDHSHEIKSVGCVNPRHGTYFCIEVDLLALELSSKSATELFAEIIYLLSGGDIST